MKKQISRPHAHRRNWKKSRSKLLVAIFVGTVLVGLTVVAITHKPKVVAWSAPLTATPLTTLTTTTKALPLAVFIGDSYSNGTGASSSSLKWTSLVSQKLGWEEINLSRGGTGYLNSTTSNGYKACGRSVCQNYLAMLDQAIANKPDILVISGGINDCLDVNQESTHLLANVKEVFKMARRRLPKARIVAVSPFFPASPPPECLIKLEGWISAASRENNVLFVPDAPTWLTGKFSDFSADKMHPNDRGYSIIANEFQTWWKANVPTLTNRNGR